MTGKIKFDTEEFVDQIVKLSADKAAVQLTTDLVKDTLKSTAANMVDTAVVQSMTSIEDRMLGLEEELSRRSYRRSRSRSRSRGGCQSSERYRGDRRAYPSSFHSRDRSRSRSRGGRGYVGYNQRKRPGEYRSSRP